ncbi:sigma-54 interaction domain-containing protein [Sporomusa aerivorans]|uniref:sigma-54 interaction domain-containing protein n=1 Tax=Sporomusa aerivorans TaxID=204936 RepID=UPI00352A5090
MNYVSTTLIGESAEMKKIRKLIQHIAQSDATVLITGESGSGKEVVASELYCKSNRQGLPYIKINCAAFPDSLIESELFGYEQGAFTGASSNGKMGMFEMANKGTILLDEISETPLILQAKLLRVLQEKEFIRIGGRKSIKLDVRVIATSNQDMYELIKQGRFRKDLFYRLNIIPISLPPLRERKEDIPLLAHYFLNRFNIKYGMEKQLDNSAIKAMMKYDWPGNIRELENAIERIVVSSEDETITQNDLPYSNRANVLVKGNFGRSITLREALDTFEREFIQNALEHCGSTYKAAKVLGVSQPTVFRKARALGINLVNAAPALLLFSGMTLL